MLCPVIVLSVNSELSSCAVFLHETTQLGSREKGTIAEHGFARSASQLFVEIWECGAGLVAASCGEERTVSGLWRGRANFGGTGFGKGKKCSLNLYARLGTD